MLKRGMGILGLTAMLVTAIQPVSVQASELGVVTALSEKLYVEKNTESAVLANILQNSTIEIIFTEMDEAGGLWFYIRTDTGQEGYLPAQSAMTVSAQTEQSQSEAASTEVKPTDEEQQNQSEHKITTLDNVNIRENPTVNSQIKGNIPQGTEVSYTQSIRNEQDEVWYAVTYQGIDGYITETVVSSEQVSDEPEQIETVEQKENVQTTETESQAESSDTAEEAPQPTVSEQTTQEQTEAKMVNNSYKSRLPEKFEVLICLGMIACSAIVIFLIKKIKRML